MQPEGLGRPATRQAFLCALLDDLSLKVAKVSIPMGKSEEMRRRGQVPPKGTSNSAPPHPPRQVRYQAPEEPCPLAGSQDLPCPRGPTCQSLWSHRASWERSSGKARQLQQTLALWQPLDRAMSESHQLV